MGSYPDVGLKAARKARDTAKLQKLDGRDPVQARKVDMLKATRTGGDTFKAVALKWYGKQAPWCSNGRLLPKLGFAAVQWHDERVFTPVRGKLARHDAVISRVAG